MLDFFLLLLLLLLLLLIIIIIIFVLLVIFVLVGVAFLTLLGAYPPLKMEQTGCFETQAYKIKTPGNYQKKAHEILLNLSTTPYTLTRKW
jgi:flagellar basal body-associated protein FliL